MFNAVGLRLTHPSKDAMMVRNADGTIRYWSDGAQNLYGWEPKDALGTTSHQLLKTVFPAPLDVIDDSFAPKEPGKANSSMSARTD
jgi:PAS domain-containing protein